MIAAYAFADGNLLLLAPLVLSVLWLHRSRTVPAAPSVPSSAAQHAPRVRDVRATVARFAPGLEWLGILLGCVALARPVERIELPRQALGIDILMVLDTSSSMAEPLAADAPRPTRIDAVARAAADFVGRRRDDRIGVVRFAAFADLVCPLTLDHGAVEDSLADLEPLDPEDPEDRTGIGTACARAASILRAGSEPTTERVVVLFTDGLENVTTPENPRAIGPVEAAEACRALGIRVHVISTAPGEDDATSPQTTALAQLGERTGGTLTRLDSRADGTTLDGVFAKIDALERAPLEEPRTDERDRYLPFLLAAFVAVALGRLLSRTARRTLP